MAHLDGQQLSPLKHTSCSSPAYWQVEQTCVGDWPSRTKVWDPWLTAKPWVMPEALNCMSAYWVEGLLWAPPHGTEKQLSCKVFPEPHSCFWNAWRILSGRPHPLRIYSTESSTCCAAPPAIFFHSITVSAVTRWNRILFSLSLKTLTVFP